MILNVNGKQIDFCDVVDVFDTHGPHCREVEVHGYDIETGCFEYSAIGMETCGELDIDEDTIEELI